MELDIAFNEEPYDFDSYMEKLNNELKKKEAEIEEAKKRVAELLAAKIYTRKELKQINERKRGTTMYMNTHTYAFLGIRELLAGENGRFVFIICHCH